MLSVYAYMAVFDAGDNRLGEVLDALPGFQRSERRRPKQSNKRSGGGFPQTCPEIPKDYN